MAAEGKGWLSKIFMTVVKTVTIGLVAAVAWQIFLDPLFFPIIHDTTNVVAQAWMMKVNSMFGWIPQAAGLAKEPGLLTGVMKSFLSKEMALLAPPPTEAVMQTFAGGLSLDAI
jgi:hypothetical protein